MSTNIKLIDKDALLAEIKRLRKRARDLYGCSQFDTAYKKVLETIDTLDVKEVDLEKEIDEVIHNYKVNDHQHSSICSADIEWIAEHFFELGLKAMKGGNE